MNAFMKRKGNCSEGDASSPSSLHYAISGWPVPLIINHLNWHTSRLLQALILLSQSHQVLLRMLSREAHYFVLQLDWTERQLQNFSVLSESLSAKSLGVGWIFVFSCQIFGGEAVVAVAFFTLVSSPQHSRHRQSRTLLHTLYLHFLP